MNNGRANNRVVCRKYIKGILRAESAFLISTEDDFFDLAPIKDEGG